MTGLPQPTAAASINARALRVRQTRRRRFLDHLLVAPLHRAVALAQRHDLARAVAEDLHLDVARVLDELFQEQPGVLEVAWRQALHGFEGVRQFSLAPAQTRMPMPPPPAVLFSITG